jgi:uncharacterized membrane protein YcaP (DUF421 family)
MSDLFELSMPWYQFAIRGAIAYLGLFVLLRCTGKRAFGEMSPFDIVVLILVGGALRSAIVGKDTSMLGPFIAILTILLLDRLLGFLSTRSEAFNRLLEGTPLLLARSGQVIPDALKRATIPAQAFERELRLHEIDSLDRVDNAYLESNGRISILKREHGANASPDETRLASAPRKSGEP